MEEENFKQKTAFDTALQNHQLEIIKAAVPYINASEQKLISVYVKASELADTIHIFQKPGNSVGICSQENKDGSILDMLNDIRAVCTNTEKETINMLINYLNAFQLYGSYKTTFGDQEPTYTQNTSNPNNMYDNLKELLTPEQREMFDTFSIMFNS